MKLKRFILIYQTYYQYYLFPMSQHKPDDTPFFTPSQPQCTNLVQSPWDYHGTEKADFLERDHCCSPRKTGTCILKVTLRVVSNLSFTAKFDVNKTPGFERNQGFCSFWVSKILPLSNHALGISMRRPMTSSKSHPPRSGIEHSKAKSLEYNRIATYFTAKRKVLKHLRHGTKSIGRGVEEDFKRDGCVDEKG